MSEPAHWVDGRIVDDDPVPSSPWTRIAAVVLLLFVFDLLLGPRVEAGRASLDAVDHDALGSGAALRNQLRAAVEDPRRSILLVGDSVLAGDVMAGRVADWEHERVVDHLREVVAEDVEVGVHQIALDGLLPIDALHVLTELDRLDPAGRVEFVFEINLRYFSAAYLKQRDCSRPAICELGGAARLAPSPSATSVPLRDREPVRTLQTGWGLFAETAYAVRAAIRDRLPIARLRDRMPAIPPALEQTEGLLVVRESDASRGSSSAMFSRSAAVEAEARVREHYRSARLSERNAQTRALEQILDRLAAKRRPALLFVTPLADDFIERTLSDQRMGQAQAELARQVAERHADTLALTSFDHPLFVDHLFLDHCHLGPEGNRLLALNLAVELGLPLAERPGHAELIQVEDHDRSLVHRAARGFEEGPAWLAAFRDPQGVTASADGRRIVVADTGNRRLRQLRGNLQFVEVLAGQREAGPMADGDARREAQLIAPREPVLLDDPERADDPVYFLDGEHGEHVRVVAHGRVETLALRGPKCSAERLRPGSKGELWLSCRKGDVLAIDVSTRTSRLLLERVEGRTIHAITATPAGQLLIADQHGRITAYEIDDRGRAGRAVELFANTGGELLPNGPDIHYPHPFDRLRLGKVVDMQWIDRYGMLLVADELPLGQPHERHERDLHERIQLRVFDFETRQIWPWVKPIPHGEAWALWNEPAQAITSYYHRGSFTLIQAEAGLIWLERHRSRLLRMADGLLGLAKYGSSFNPWSRVHLHDSIGSEGPAELERTLRPDRWLDRRWEPLPRRGPYVALLVGSPLTSLSDRLGNYSLARRLEIELQRELGLRDAVRIDLFHRSAGGGLDAQLDAAERFVDESVPLDVLIFEVSGLGKQHGDPSWQSGLDRLAELAGRTDALVVVFDDSALEASHRDGLRASNGRVHAVLDEARARGFVVLEPSDRLLRELMTDAPWGNPPWAAAQRHGAPWAIDRTARVLRAMLSPTLREFLRDRTPARELTHE